MCRWLAVGVLVLAGCGRTPPALQPGDEVRPEVVLAPEAPWPPGARVAIELFLRVHRPGRTGSVYLDEKDVPHVPLPMRARVTFLSGGSPLGPPLEVPFVRDC
jgi:hypothetical protein